MRHYRIVTNGIVYRIQTRTRRWPFWTICYGDYGPRVYGTLAEAEADRTRWIAEDRERARSWKVVCP